jgi:Kef-type K+ transport system membrane component KefB
MGRIPGLTAAVFPPAGMAPFRLAANIGLIPFLFLVGLEINLDYLLSNWRIAISVAALDMAVPFRLGVALAYGLYTSSSASPAQRPSRLASLPSSSAWPLTLQPSRHCAASSRSSSCSTPRWVSLC